jgi:cytochrome c-type biogenesis protein CcmF
MEIEDILLISSLVFVAIDIILFTRKGSNNRFGKWLSSLGFASFAAYYVLFIRAFLVSDFVIEQVYSYSSSSLPWMLKFFASWGGSSGSLLLIVLFIGLAYIGYRLYMESGASSGVSIAKLLGILFLYFIVLILFKGPFQRFGVTPPDGMGLNPQLQSIWMCYHPLVVFAGYTFVVLAFALILARMEGDTGHDRLLDFSLKSAWFLFTIGIALGGLWAYQILGWGGYWTWDPVETSSLLPWLALTAYLHGSSNSFRRDIFPEAMVLLSFDSLIFLGALTRGGLLTSVHAYAFSPAGPALLICIVVATAYFAYLKNKLGKPLLSWPTSHAPIQTKMMLVSQLALLGIFWVCFIGIIVPTVQNLVTGSAEATSFEFYNYVSLPFVLVFVVASMFCGATSKSIRLRLCALFATVGGSIIFLVLGYPSSFAATNVVMPILIVAGVIVAIDLVTSFSKMPSLAITGRQTIHLGVIIVLIGIFVSSSMSGEIHSISVGVSSPAENFGDLNLSVGEVTMTLGSGSAYVAEMDHVMPEQSSMSVQLQVTYSGRTYSGVLVEQYYPNYSMVAHPTILGDGVTDIYINLVPDQIGYNALFNTLIGIDTPPQMLTLQVSTKPFVNVIWWGLALMSVGIAASLIASLRGSVAKVSVENLEAVSDRPEKKDFS